ncbi:14671_t:CDS:2, partial [Cetraspora pellucida]
EINFIFGSGLFEQARENFYLDVNLSPLDTEKPKWIYLDTSIPANSGYASACVGGTNKDIIFLLEHTNPDSAISNHTVVYTFNTTSQEWSTLDLNGTYPESRKQFQAVNDSNGKIYMFGGLSATNETFLNNIIILDSLNLKWPKVTTSGAPTSRYDFSAVLLNNGLILYLGGNDITSYNFYPITAYNTTDGSWSFMAVTGDITIHRSSHSAVLSPDGFVIIYGGIGTNNSVVIPLIVLDTNVSPYKLSNKPMVDIIPVYNNDSFNFNSNIYILDTRNYSWISYTSVSNNIDASINNNIGVSDNHKAEKMIVIII